MHVVRILPDVSGLDASFDYSVPPEFAPLPLGTLVRVVLQCRRVDGWVVDANATPPPGVVLQPITRVLSQGPDAELIGLAEWATRRWLGKLSFFLKTATPQRRVPVNIVKEVSNTVKRQHAPIDAAPDHRVTLHVHGTRWSAYEMLRAWFEKGECLVLVPHARTADVIATRFRHEGCDVAVHPNEWGNQYKHVIGTRAAVFSPISMLSRVIVLDCHDEAYVSERSPTWNAIDIAIERTKRLGIPCELLSATPRVSDISRADTVDWQIGASTWSPLTIVDLRFADPHEGLYTSTVISLLRSTKRLVCVMNRKGRAQLLLCKSCQTIASCPECEGALQMQDKTCVCARCQKVHACFCRECGATQLKQLRIGTKRVREDLERLAGRSVGEITGESRSLPDDEILVGTEAVLHRVSSADAVIFLDFDQELHAGRYRAAEDAFVLLGRAAKLVSRKPDGVVVVQTRVPMHDVIQAAVHGDARRLLDPERERRQAMHWPPYGALARISGNGAADFIEWARTIKKEHAQNLTFLQTDDTTWIARAGSHDDLVSALQLVPRPKKTLRIEVDPVRV